MNNDIVWETAESYNPWGKKRVRGTHCSKGHEFTDENTFIRPYDQARVCRQCRKEYAKMKYQERKDKNNGVARVKKEKPKTFEIPDTAKILDKALPAWRTLWDALQYEITPCMIEGPERFADRPETVSEEDARNACRRCPLVIECYEFAVANEEKWGIWGGVNFTKIEETLFEFDE